MKASRENCRKALEALLDQQLNLPEKVFKQIRGFLLAVERYLPAPTENAKERSSSTTTNPNSYEYE